MFFFYKGTLGQGFGKDAFSQRVTMFKHMKSSGFNLHKTRLKTSFAISNLILIAALAFIMLFCLAIDFEDSSLRKKVQRLRPDRNVLSLFVFATKLCDYLVAHEMPFTISFQFSKESEIFIQKDG
jgi:hypothetical protein